MQNRTITALTLTVLAGTALMTGCANDQRYAENGGYWAAEPRSGDTNNQWHSVHEARQEGGHRYDSSQGYSSEPRTGDTDNQWRPVGAVHDSSYQPSYQQWRDGMNDRNNSSSSGTYNSNGYQGSPSNPYSGLNAQNGYDGWKGRTYYQPNSSYYGQNGNGYTYNGNGYSSNGYSSNGYSNPDGSGWNGYPTQYPNGMNWRGYSDNGYRYGYGYGYGYGPNEMYPNGQYGSSNGYYGNGYGSPNSMYQGGSYGNGYYGNGYYGNGYYGNGYYGNGAYGNYGYPQGNYGYSNPPYNSSGTWNNNGSWNNTNRNNPGNNNWNNGRNNTTPPNSGSNSSGSSTGGAGSTGGSSGSTGTGPLNSSGTNSGSGSTTGGASGSGSSTSGGTGGGTGGGHSDAGTTGSSSSVAAGATDDTSNTYGGYNAQATQPYEGWRNQSQEDQARMGSSGYPQRFNDPQRGGGRTWGYTAPPQGAPMMGDMGPMIVANWPDQQRRGVSMLVDRYGPPDEVTPSAAVWHSRGPFDCIKVFREEVQHQWPVAHSDFIENTVAYKVPVDKVGDLAKFDGSLIVDRTKGRLAARCDSEPHNVLALNLANDICTGSKNVNDARDYLARALKDEQSGTIDDYMKSLRFTWQSPIAAADPGQAESK